MQILEAPTSEQTMQQTDECATYFNFPMSDHKKNFSTPGKAAKKRFSPDKPLINREFGALYTDLSNGRGPCQTSIPTSLSDSKKFSKGFLNLFPCDNPFDPREDQIDESFKIGEALEELPQNHIMLLPTE